MSKHNWQFIDETGTLRRCWCGYAEVKTGEFGWVYSGALSRTERLTCDGLLKLHVSVPKAEYETFQKQSGENALLRSKLATAEEAYRRLYEKYLELSGGRAPSERLSGVELDRYHSRRL